MKPAALIKDMVKACMKGKLVATAKQRGQARNACMQAVSQAIQECDMPAEPVTTVVTVTKTSVLVSIVLPVPHGDIELEVPIGAQ